MSYIGKEEDMRLVRVLLRGINLIHPTSPQFERFGSTMDPKKIGLLNFDVEFPN
jgi:hypothetical protein